MTEYTKRYIKKALEQHKMWLENPETGKRADFSGKFLAYAKFMLADLRNANFKNAEMLDADFEGANLAGANLEGVIGYKP